MDPDILERLDALEREEDELERQFATEATSAPTEGDADVENKVVAQAIRRKKKLIRAKHGREKGKNHGVLPRTAKPLSADDIAKHLESRDVAPGEAHERASAMASRGKKRGRSIRRGGDAADSSNADGDVAMEGASHVAKRARSQSAVGRSKSRSRSVVPRSREGTLEVSAGDPYASSAQKKQALVKAAKGQRKMQRVGKLGESDRKIVDLKPKHLFSGKRGVGKTDRR